MHRLSENEVHRNYDQLACCDVVTRGAAFYKGRVYLGALDGRLSQSIPRAASLLADAALAGAALPALP
ncbi:MAG TPA: hypothetical protein VNJ02_01555 [Vicinamibacterales bacterium]|nr:hypothetical protein [Vicinamibacterales bacterium]